MRNYFKQWRGLLAVMALMSVVACSKENDDIITDGDDDEQEELLSVDSMHYEIVKGQLLEADTFAPGVIKYTLRNGEVLDASCPEVYSIGVDSLPEARAFFYTNCVPIGEYEKVTVEGNTYLYDLGDYGHIRYIEENKSDLTAVIEIELTGVKEVKRLECIPMSLWPNNAESPFWVGDIVVDKQKGWWWLCVRACEGGKPGILMTFDGGWEDTKRSDHYKSYTKRTGCATHEAWNALAQYYYSDKARFRAMYKQLEKIGASNNMKFRALEELYRPEEVKYMRTHQIGDTWDDKYYWAAKVRRVWEARTYYVKVSGATITMVNGMPQFEADNYYFKRSWDPKMPQWRDSHSRTFTAWDGSKDKYTVKYPIYE